jgi:hypothetical protein
MGPVPMTIILIRPLSCRITAKCHFNIFDNPAARQTEV